MNGTSGRCVEPARRGPVPSHCYRRATFPFAATPARLFHTPRASPLAGFPAPVIYLCVSDYKSERILVAKKAKTTRSKPARRPVGPLGMTEAEKWRELCRFWRERALALESHLVERLDRLSSMVAALGEKSPTFWDRVRARFARNPAPAPFDASEIDF